MKTVKLNVQMTVELSDNYPLRCIGYFFKRELEDKHQCAYQTQTKDYGIFCSKVTDITITPPTVADRPTPFTHPVAYDQLSCTTPGCVRTAGHQNAHMSADCQVWE